MVGSNPTYLSLCLIKHRGSFNGFCLCLECSVPHAEDFLVSEYIFPSFEIKGHEGMGT
jgi:hypothetical protein